MTRGPIMGTMKVSGFPDIEHGQVITGIDICNHNEAMLLEMIIHKAMADMAGTSAEKVLARWSNSIAASRRKAINQNWKGWRLPS